MEPKKHRKNGSYTVMIISDSSEGGIKQFFLGSKVVTFLISLFVVFFVAVACYIGYSMYTAKDLNKQNTYLENKVTELNQQNTELSTLNTELTDKVSILSSTINQKVEEEATVAEKFVPNGFPLSGTATIQEETEENTGNDPIVHFMASSGISVIATGNGTILAIEQDENGNFALQIDHGNGYISVYLNAKEPKVKVGDEVTRGTRLFEMSEENRVLGYQIIQEGGYIDPLELMEIYG